MSLFGWARKKLVIDLKSTEDRDRLLALWGQLEKLLADSNASGEIPPGLFSECELETQGLIKEILATSRPVKGEICEQLRGVVIGEGADPVDYVKARLWEWLKKPALAEHAYRACLARGTVHAEANNRLGLLLLASERWDEAIASFGCAIELQPSNAIFHHNLGRALFRVGEYDDAFACFKKAWDMDKHSHPFRSNLFQAAVVLRKYDVASMVVATALASGSDVGRASGDLGADQHTLVDKSVAFWSRIAEADLAAHMGEFDRATALYSALHELFAFASHTGLGNIAMRLGDLAKAETHFEAALRVSPDNSLALRNMASVIGLRGNIDTALRLVDEAISKHEATPSAILMKAALLLKIGRWSEGWKCFEARLDTVDVKSGLCYFFQGTPRWAGEPLNGKVLALVGEQGAGDRIQFVRYASVIKQMGGEVIVHCEPSLKRLFETVPGVARVYTGGEPLARIYDYWISMLSVPNVLATTESSLPSTVPYVFPDAEACRGWLERLGVWPGMRVGLVWAGNPALGGVASFIDSRRSFPLELYGPLLELDGVSWFSLQKGPQSRQLDDFSGARQIVDYSEEWTDYADTAAFINALDLVITVDTSVAHLAGALGKPVWILSRFDACWRWLEGRSDSPWYPTARIFTQQRQGEWNKVIDQVVSALQQRLNLIG